MPVSAEPVPLLPAQQTFLVQARFFPEVPGNVLLACRVEGLQVRLLEDLSQLLTLDDERLWEYPWIYFVEPGNLRLTEEEVETVREFLLRGGTATFDDFHGPVEWDSFQREMKRVFPDRDIVRLGLGRRGS